VICNRYKGTDIAAIDQSSGKITRLFDPRSDLWRDHFRLEGATIEPISSVGSATVKLLRLNVPERISERRLLQSLGRYPQK
jgi:hypothetical protein